MKTKLTNTILKVSLTATLSTQVNAQTTEQPADLGSSTILGNLTQDDSVASSLKTGTPVSETPRSISIYTADQIEKQAIDSIGDIVDYTPGVNTSQGEGHRDSVVFRGVRSTADFYVDGVRDDVQYYRSLYNLEQVEILKGPSALFFGRGGAGGVINRVTKTAKIGEDFTTIKGSGDTFGGTEASFDLNHQLSDNVSVRINAFNETLRNHRDFFDGDRFGITPTFKIQLGDSTTLDLSYQYEDHERFIDRGIPGINGVPGEQFSNTTFGDSELNLNDFEGHTFNAKLNHTFLSGWKASATAAYSNQSKIYTNYFPSDFDVATNQVEIDGYQDTTNRDRFTLAGDILGEFQTGAIGHKVIFGGELNITNSRAFRFNNVFDSNGDDQQFFDADGFRLSNGVVRAADGSITDFGSFSDLNDDTRVDLTTYSFFVQDEISLHEKLDVVLGARFDSFDIDVDNLADPSQSDSRTDTEISPKIGVVYKPTDAVSVYGSYTQSFLPRSGEQFADINGDDARLDPDEFSNLEFGVKWSVNERLLLSASVFEIEETSLSVNSLDTDTFDQTESEVRGAELSLKGYITDKWHISAGYSYLEGEVESGSNEGNTIRELPEHTFSIWNQYAVNDKLSLGLGLTYQDASFANDDNAVELPSYVRVDASASYQVSEALQVQLNIENLFDRDYFPNAHTNNNITVGAPVNATLGVKYEF